MRRWLLIPALWLAVGMTCSGAEQIHALMIRASNDPSVIDRRLEQVEYKLRRVFGFPYYHFVAEQTVIAPANGEVTVPLAHGHRLVLSGRGLAVTVRWLDGSETLLTTRVTLQRNAPVILGGVPYEGDTLIVALTGK